MMALTRKRVKDPHATLRDGAALTVTGSGSGSVEIPPTCDIYLWRRVEGDNVPR